MRCVEWRGKPPTITPPTPATSERKRERSPLHLQSSPIPLQVAASAFFRGQMCRPGGHTRPDLRFFSDQEQQQLQGAREALLRHRSRPSLLQVGGGESAGGKGGPSETGPASHYSCEQGGSAGVQVTAYATSPSYHTCLPPFFSSPHFSLPVQGLLGAAGMALGAVAAAAPPRVNDAITGNPHSPVLPRVRPLPLKGWVPPYSYSCVHRCAVARSPRSILVPSLFTRAGRITFH